MSMNRELLVALVLAVAVSAPGLADDEIAGEWQLTIEFGGQDVFATLVIEQKDDGTYTGTWGANELSNVMFDGERLTFDRVSSFGDREFTMSFDGALKDGRLEGVVSNPQGELQVKAVRAVPKSPALGRWDISFSIQDREMTARLTVTQDAEGTLEADWTAEFAEYTVNNVRFEDGELTVDRTVRFQEQEFDSAYVAQVEGDTLTGHLVSDFGEIPANGTRFGTELIGTWELTATTDEGSRTRILKVNPDLTGRYDFFLAEIPVEVTLDGENVSFHWEMAFGDNTLETDFTGTLAGGNLTGELVSPRGTSQITGKRLNQD